MQKEGLRHLKEDGDPLQCWLEVLGRTLLVVTCAGSCVGM